MGGDHSEESSWDCRLPRELFSKLQPKLIVHIVKITTYNSSAVPASSFRKVYESERRVKAVVRAAESQSISKRNIFV